jgi:hypothetical protein
LAPFGQAVSEEKMFLTFKSQSEKKINLGDHVIFLAHLALM